MGCTTILVGKKASYNGSTLIARNDDAQAGNFTEKKMAVITPSESIYKSVISGVEIPLPSNGMRYTAVPNALNNEGIWAAAGVNEENIGMTATETITSNPRVLGADPLVEKGIGEEDIVVLVLPYIHSAREGVLRLGSLLEEYGTYEMNGIAFSDVNEIWWLETVGGHHWYAKRVPDDQYVVMPNQLGIDDFDLEDAYHQKENHLCSDDLKEFIDKNHLNLQKEGHLNPRLAFGSHSDQDHTYNTPRAWIINKYFNKKSQYEPTDDDIPFSSVPDHLITIEDIKYVLSHHYQGTDYDVYGKYSKQKGLFRPIGINRNDFLSCIELRGDQPFNQQAIEWITFGSNVYNAFIPLYMHVETLPEYLVNTTGTVDTDNFYWANRLIGALSDPYHQETNAIITRYQNKVAILGHYYINKYDPIDNNEEANEVIVQALKKETDQVLKDVLFIASNKMKNSFSMSDA